MSRQVHVLGAGVVGSFLMRTLEAEGIDFTWYDPDFDPESSPVQLCAWKASTGCIFPSGEKTDEKNYEHFEESARRLGVEYEVARYCFSQNSIPHRENSKKLLVEKEDSGLKFLNLPSFHVNVQNFVQTTRERYRDRFSTGSHTESLNVHAHGFHKALKTDYRWGWHARARLRTREPGRFCFNLKEGRFIVGYLYPIPGTEEYYLGTHFLYQREAKEVEWKDKHLKMLEHIQSKTAGFIESIDVDWDTRVVGWRPAYVKEQESPAVVEKDGVLFLRPQMANGLRHHVTFLEEVLKEIKEKL
jgi:hypothetical protein